jgi:spermidine synthase
VDAPDPTTSRINRYYTEEFFTEVKRSLVPGGVLACSLGRYENYVSEELARVLACGRRTLERCYTHVLPIPGGKVFFLASDGPLDQDIATALAREGIDTRHVRPSALRAIMSPDRLADLERAMAWPAGINRDFNPILYFYCLVHWASQYEVRAGLWTGVAVLAGAVYLLRLRPAPLVLFASGFAASALEMVLLLVFQILYGSVYRQVGAIVTLFMAGLAGGALAAARWSRARIASSPARVDGRRERRTLALTGLVLGAVAAALPLMLPGGPPGGGSATGAWLGPALIFGLSFALAALVGAQFPLAAQLEPSGPVTTASRLYAADLLGACLGALLASAFLIPVLGLRTVCWLTGGLCGLAALRLWGGRGS